MANSEKYNNVIVLSKKRIMFNNFLGGISWAIGTFVGLLIVVLIVGSIFSRINLIPIFGNFLSQVVNEAVKNNPNLIESPR